MRDEERQVVGRETVAGQDALGGLREHPHGHLEDVAAPHLRVVHPLVDRVVSGRVTRAAGRLVQQLPVLAVGVQVDVDDAAVLVGRLQHGGAGGVGQQDAGPPVGEVGDLRQRLGADAEHATVLAGLHELGAGRQAVHRARAGGQQVDRAGPAAAEPVLDDVADRGKDHVRRGRADRDELDVLGDQVGALQRLLGGLHREIGGGLAVVGDAPLADAGTLHDPLVARVDQLLEIRVGQHALGCVGADTDDPCPRHSRPPSRPPRAISASSAALMCSLSPAVAHSAATRTAFLIAFTGEAP